MALIASITDWLTQPGVRIGVETDICNARMEAIAERRGCALPLRIFFKDHEGSTSPAMEIRQGGDRVGSSYQYYYHYFFDMASLFTSNGDKGPNAVCARRGPLIRYEEVDSMVPALA